MSWAVKELDGPGFVAAYKEADDKLVTVDRMEVRLRYCTFYLFDHDRFFVVEDAGQVQGVACLLPDKTGDMGISYLSVDPRYQRRGIATTLVRAIKEFAQRIGQDKVSASEFSDEGARYLRKVLEREFGPESGDASAQRMTGG